MNTPPRYVSPRPLAVRRRLVLAAYLGYAALLLAWTLLPRPWNLLVAGIVGVLTVAAGGNLMRPRHLGISDGPDTLLDERQLRIRNEAYLNAYRVLGLLFIVVPLYAMIGLDNGWWLPRTFNELQAVFWGALLLASTLPSAILAWTEPDLRE
ncbi:hypothetical protein [uncultured Deinococcus sp.]|uniref:hypothetical protein n=1 Tax=uncultured Deinococcus sp. TaxID=158789 RepID=UPI0025E41FFF|nr:hypothetical protein [uncultured Deinococcus sp.]